MISFTNEECDYFLEKADTMTHEEIDRTMLMLNLAILQTLRGKTKEFEGER